MKSKLIITSALAGLLCLSAQADITVGVGESTDPWLGFMNVFNLPADGGDFQFGGSWGIPDLNAAFDDGASTLTLSPNTIGDPNEYWYKEAPGGDPGDPNNGGPGAPGNKLMEANLYIENDALNVAGSVLTFQGNVQANTLTGAHATRAFIKEFAADYSTSTDSYFDITGTGAFSVQLTTSGTVGNHIQYGFQTTGENVWVTDVGPFGSVVVDTIPEPATIGLIGLFGGGLLFVRRRFKI